MGGHSVYHVIYNIILLVYQYIYTSIAIVILILVLIKKRMDREREYIDLVLSECIIKTIAHKRNEMKEDQKVTTYQPCDDV